MTEGERMVGLRRALRALYTPSDSVSAADRSAADSFLQAFLFSPDCWQLSLSLIRSPDAEFFEQLFCARALHQRLRCSVIKSVQTQASHQVITAEEWDKCREALVRPNKSLAQQALQSCLFSQRSGPTDVEAPCKNNGTHRLCLRPATPLCRNAVPL